MCTNTKLFESSFFIVPPRNRNWNDTHAFKTAIRGDACRAVDVVTNR